MNLTKKILLALGVVAAANASFAQTTTAAGASSSAGVLGQKYADVSFGLQDIRHYSKHAYDGTAAVNLPVSPNLDLTGSYSYGWLKGPAAAHANTFGISATAYSPMNGVKPFVTGGVGYQFLKGPRSTDYGIWGVAAGVEIPVGAFSLTPRISYADDFLGSRLSSQQFSYDVEANYWLSGTSAVYGSVGKIDVRQSSFDAWSYRVGVRLKF